MNKTTQSHGSNTNDFQLMIEVDGRYIPVADHVRLNFERDEIESLKRSMDKCEDGSIMKSPLRPTGSNYTPPKKKHKKKR